MTTDYDYIIAGSGCAGLSLAMRLLKSGQLRGKSLLIVDAELKNTNDRTWCFWEKEPGFFENLVAARWDRLQFADDKGMIDLDIDPYQYKLIKGIDFYDYCLRELSSHANITLLQEHIEGIFSDEETGIIIKGRKYYADFVFNSTLEKPKLQKGDIWMLQHFKGIYITTESPSFNPGVATLMDFSISQEHGAAFFYVLPFSETQALIEYTLFSPALLDRAQYDDAISAYITTKLNVKSYRIDHSEFGVIPMTNFKFRASEGNIVNIGTAGGQTKGSSGYTFQFIQEHSGRIVSNLQQGLHPGTAHTATRFDFYDGVLLDVLYNNRVPGRTVFSKMFRSTKASNILKFLDNKTNLLQELSIISTLPTLPFSKAAWQQLFR